MDVIIGNIEEYWHESVFLFAFEKYGEAGSRTRVLYKRREEKAWKKKSSS
ncbi:hypothetical protein ANABIO32_01440 [Rossellomorea marisflavi]|nr:hypothetical protein ANABIO32_01440 [Rossellomorea marisflavi]